MKLNLGCGFDKREGWLNVDNFAACEPDRLLDIEATPWPFASDSFDEILLKHVLEHVGQQTAVFFAVLRELYRVTKPAGRIEIQVPHYLHETYHADPTHVRAFTLLTFRMLSKRQNREWVAKKANYTMLALMLDIDFEIEQAKQVYDPNWLAMLQRGQISREELRQRAQTHAGVVREIHCILRAVKG